MPGTELLFLGTSACLPNPDNDTASYLIDRKLLVDTGWCCIQNMREAGVDPGEVRNLLFTHLHHDHYLSLPSFLFYHLCVGTPLSALTIIGPAGDLESVVARAMDFLQVKRFYEAQSSPELIPLMPGDSCEAAGFRIESRVAFHPVDALCYRATGAGGAALGFTGDTRYDPGLGAFFYGCDALIHECSLGPESPNSEVNARYQHSSASDAGRVAREAEVSHLILTHGNTDARRACVRAAKSEFDGRVTWPERGMAYQFL